VLLAFSGRKGGGWNGQLVVPPSPLSLFLRKTTCLSVICVDQFFNKITLNFLMFLYEIAFCMATALVVG